jgi:phage tail-like protein
MGRLVTPLAVDHYHKFRYLLRWEHGTVAGFSSMSVSYQPAVVAKAVLSRNKGSPQEAPKRIAYDAITLERGVTHDAEFEEWAKSGAALAAMARPGEVPRDVIVESYDDGNRLEQRFKLTNCRVARFETPGSRPVDNKAVVIEQLKLEYEGWEQQGADADS